MWLHERNTGILRLRLRMTIVLVCFYIVKNSAPGSTLIFLGSSEIKADPSTALPSFDGNSGRDDTPSDDTSSIVGMTLPRFSGGSRLKLSGHQIQVESVR